MSTAMEVVNEARDVIRWVKYYSSITPIPELVEAADALEKSIKDFDQKLEEKRRGVKRLETVVNKSRNCGGNRPETAKEQAAE